MNDIMTMAVTVTTATGCPVCGAGHIQPFFELDSLPINANVPMPTRQQALDVPCADLKLAFCPACGHVFNLNFDPAIMTYDEGYENSLHFSTRFQDYAQRLAADLVERHNLRGGSVVEIGSGRGDFLRLLMEHGVSQAAGYDPSYAPTAEDLSDPRVKLFQAYYDVDTAAGLAEVPDLILARQTLEHIPQPGTFVSALRRAVGNSRTAVFFEVPNVLYILRSLSVWDLIYEHASYFSAPSLASALEIGGFGDIRTDERFGGQYLSAEGRPVATGSLPKLAGRAVEVEALAADVESFVHRFERKTAEWEETLASLQSSGRRAVVWGAGSKGIMFLNLLKSDEAIPYVVDINPRKHGMHISGAGQQIVPPEFLLQYRPEVIILMNPIYQKEIFEMVRTLGLEPEFLQA